MFCKVNILLFSSLLNMITASVGRWVGGRWVSGRWSVDLIKPIYLRFSEQMLFQTFAYDWKDYISKMLSTNRCFLLTTELNIRGVLKVSFSIENINEFVKYSLRLCRQIVKTPLNLGKILNNTCEIRCSRRLAGFYVDFNYGYFLDIQHIFKNSCFWKTYVTKFINYSQVSNNTGVGIKAWAVGGDKTVEIKNQQARRLE